MRLHYEGILQERLDELGEMPLPPYIKERLDDPDRYQTVYAKESGSAHQQRVYILLMIC